MRVHSLLIVLLFACRTKGTENNKRKVGVIPFNTSCSELFQNLITPNSFIEVELLCITNTFSDDDFDGVSNATRLIEETEIEALIGPYSDNFAFATEYKRVPFIVTSMVPRGKQETPFLVRVLPDIKMYGAAVNDIVTYFNWGNVGLLYDSIEGPFVLSNLLDKEPAELKAYNLRLNYTETYIRWALKSLRDKFINKFIVICSSKTADIVLTQALYLSLLSPRPNTWLVVNLGVDVVDIDKFLDSRANLTSLQIMVNSESSQCALTKRNINLPLAIYSDALRVVTDIIHKNLNTSRLQMRKTLRQININGCTGVLRFSKLGVRNETFFKLSTLTTMKNGSSDLFQSGIWRSGKSKLSDRIEPSKSYDAVMRLNDDIFGGSLLRVTTIIEEPFIQWKNKTADDTKPVGELLEGFCISILEEMSKILKFSYNISLVKDGKYGSYKGKEIGWTGMVSVLLNDEADIALAPFQITPKRSKVVDFTKPYMTKGTSVVVMRPERSVSPFQFLMPLSKDVWITIFVSFLSTSTVLFAVSRVNCDRQAKYTHNLRESFWYIWGTILRGNLTGSPQGVSSRIISSVWWFFSLIIISIYTANLAAFLTIANAHIPIESASDLPNQDIYNYGTVEGSQIENFFKGTNIPDYQTMYAHMKITDKAIVRRVGDGFRQVRTQKYAFLWDSPVVRHATANDCKLMEIGSPFDLKGYGIATQKNSPYTEQLSLCILKLNDNGILYRLEGKWWRRPNCKDQYANANSKEIAIEVASGMFYVLLAGIVLASLVFVIEYMYNKSCDGKKKRETEREEHNLQNHVGNNSIDVEKEDEIRTVIARTLSIGDNSLNRRWDTEQF